MRLPPVCAALAVCVAIAAAPAQAYDERPMRLPPPPSAAQAASSSQPRTWLVAAVPGSRRAAAIARRHGARRLRTGAVYRVATGRARAFAADLRRARALRYAEPNSTLRRASAFDSSPGGYARGYVVGPQFAPPAPGAAMLAVVDDLVDLAHPDLASNTRHLRGGPVLGPHGTMVASAAAAALNGFGVVGMFPSAPVLSVGLPLEISCADAADAISDAARAGARVINLSFGSDEDCASLFGAVQIAYARGSLVVAAAGNELADGNPIIYPAAYPHVLSVAALSSDLRPASFSSENSSVDVAAPGVGIPVAIPGAFDVEDGRLDGITYATGTSFAAPIVAGAATWLATARGKLTNGQIADLLRRSARDVGAKGYDPATGFGLIQLNAALTMRAPENDPLEPNDGISFVDGSVFASPDPYVWRGYGRRSFGSTVDVVEDPVDVYRIRLPRRSRARISVRPRFGNPDLTVFSSSARSIGDSGRIVARSRRSGSRIDSVTIRNRSRVARRFYVVVQVGRDRGGSLNASYRLELRRMTFR